MNDFFDELDEQMADFKDVGREKLQDDEREWHRKRLGKISASMMGKLMTNGRGKDAGMGQTAITEAMRLAMERQLTPEGQELYIDELMTRDFKQTRWGKEWEPVAIERAGMGIVKAGARESGGVWATPDGITPDGMVVEVKCPFTLGNHRRENYIDDYIDQVQTQMYVFDAPGAYFIKFDPRVKSPYDIYIQRVERNFEHIERIIARVAEVELLISKILAL
jgi:hypothetical protein